MFYSQFYNERRVTGHKISLQMKWQKTDIAALAYHIIHLSSVVQLCPTLCNPMDCSTPDFPVLHYLLEFAQTLVH